MAVNYSKNLYGINVTDWYNLGLELNPLILLSATIRMQMTPSYPNDYIYLFSRFIHTYIYKYTDTHFKIYKYVQKEIVSMFQNLLKYYICVLFLVTVCQDFVRRCRSGSLEQLAVQLKTILFISYYLFTEK